MKSSSVKEPKTWLIFENEVEEYFDMCGRLGMGGQIRQTIKDFLGFIDENTKKRLEKMKEKHNKATW